jgi:hypothetical protein
MIKESIVSGFEVIKVYFQPFYPGMLLRGYTSYYEIVEGLGYRASLSETKKYSPGDSETRRSLFHSCKYALADNA